MIFSQKNIHDTTNDMLTILKALSFESSSLSAGSIAVRFRLASLGDMLVVASDMVEYWLRYSRRTFVNPGGPQNEFSCGPSANLIQWTKFEMDTQCDISIKPQGCGRDYSILIIVC